MNLVLGLTSSRLSAQIPDGTKSVTVKETWTLWTPVFCDGQQINYVTGVVEASRVYQFVGGILIWSNISSQGEVPGQSSEILR
jgi:hypothetical protein